MSYVSPHHVEALTAPLPGWAPASAPRERSRFRTTPGATLTQLEEEAAKLAGGASHEVRVALMVSPGEIRLDGRLRANASPSHPGVSVTIETKAKRWRFATDKYATWVDNLRGVVLGLQALRAVDRHGITEGQEQFTGFELPQVSGAGALARLEEIAGVDGALPLRKLVRLAMRNAHPDTGDGRATIDEVAELAKQATGAA